ncbi:hypothetical protein JY651_11910 [Pyxidicoccus parkwayensis]|uniref:Uncharacterized protein n=2 Tax=Pyxidicoccus parkwayensis TaxID=2813578 RepID=A0ABX7PCA4_9BACT|nr:hypothetical protein JY651_11910 [Pyxidicoccus parkwaysis]
MRKLTTASLELYYPVSLRGTALRTAARLEGCVERLRGKTWSQADRGRVLVYLTGSNFNNAYVVPDYVSTPQQMVLPSHVTLELFHFFDLGEVDVGDVACHESVHYVQLQQTDGLWGFLNKVTGGVFQANSFTESWFLEGLATYYEGRFGKDVGRPHSPVWRGWFESAAQAKDGDLNAGYLSPEHRALDPFGGNYLTGMHFVEYLAAKYGERKLWQLVDEQGESLLPPLAVTLRFKRVYGKDIGSLFHEYTQVLSQGLEARARPASQRVWLTDAGYFSRLATHPESGATALMSVGRTEYSRLTVREADGRVRFERPLVELFPLRTWVLGSSSLVSGMTFSRDGAWLYLVMADLDAEGGYTARLWRVDARTGDVVRTWDGVEGMGGDVTPDGRGYVYVSISGGDTANLVRLDLETGQREQLTKFEASEPIGPPTVSPDGTRLVFPFGGKGGWDLVLREADGSLRWLTHDGLFNYSPRWLDSERIVFLREHEGRLQAHVMTVATRQITRITDAPHLVMDVSPLGTGEVEFLNRDGTNFTVDRAPVPREESVAVAALAESPAAPVVVGAKDTHENTSPPAESAAAHVTADVEAAPGNAVPPTESPAPLVAADVNTLGSAAPAPGNLAAPVTGAVKETPESALSPTAALPQAESPAPEEFAQFPTDAGTPQPGASPSPAGATTGTPPPEASPPPADAPTALADLDTPVVSPPDPGTELHVLSDERYSTLEGFFIPEFRLPYILLTTDEDNTDQTIVSGGLAISGQDRLGFHAYSLLFSASSDEDQPSLSLAYGNAQLAPWYILASASRIREGTRTDLQGALFGTRTFWTTPVTVGLLALRREYDQTERFAGLVTRLIGPEVSASYFAGDSTSYGGTQRGLGLSVAGAVYPGAFFLGSTMGDVRLGVDGFFGGLPFTGNDNFQLSAVARFLPGAPSNLLEVGGISAGEVWYSSRGSKETSRLPLQLQPGVAFSEYLRGYEDLTTRAHNALIGTATYRYRVPIDYGWASTLWLLPSLFVSDFEVEGFGSVARVDNRNNLGAVGGAASLRLTFGQAVPVTLFYQYAYRFERGLDDLHLIGVSL